MMKNEALLAYMKASKHEKFWNGIHRAVVILGHIGVLFLLILRPPIFIVFAYLGSVTFLFLLSGIVSYCCENRRATAENRYNMIVWREENE